jgi:hypothetical protein
MFKKDSVLFGIIPALIVPVLIALMLYGFWHLGPYKEFYTSTMQSGNLTKLLALGCFLNLGIFYIFIKLEKLKAAQGVITGTLFYVLVTVFYMFF